MRKKIGELLLESGEVNQEQIRKALGRQRTYGQRLGSVFITLGFASPTAVARALAHQFGLPFVQLPEEIPDTVRSLISLDFQAEHRIVPFRLEREGRGERLHVAVDDPSDLSIVEELSFQLNKPIRVHVGAEDELDRALDLVRGRVVDPLEDDSSGELEREPGPPPTPSELLAGTSLPLLPPLEDDGDLSLITPRSALKPKLPAPPAPPPLEDEDEDIMLITPRPTAKPKAAATPPPPPPPPQEGEEVLDELLGEPEPESSGPSTASAASQLGGVPVVVFGGAAKGLPQPSPPPQLPDISEEDLKVLEDIERIADGAEPALHTEKVKPARMVASLIRLLIRKRIIREEEFLEELSRK